MPGFKFILSLILLLLTKSEDPIDSDKWCGPLPNVTDCNKVYNCIWSNDACILDECNHSVGCADTNNCKNLTVQERNTTEDNVCQESLDLITKTYCIGKDRDNISLCDTILLQNGVLEQCKCLSENWCSGAPRTFDWDGDSYATCTLGASPPTAPWNEYCKNITVSTCETESIFCYNTTGVCLGDPCYSDNIQFNYDSDIPETVVCHPGCLRGSITLTFGNETNSDTYNFCYHPDRNSTIDECSYYVENGYSCTQTNGILTTRISVLMLSLITLTLALFL